METIHVKFDELTVMAFEHRCLEPKTNRFNVDDSSEKSNQTPSKADLDDLFGPMYEEYFKKKSPEVSTNSTAPITLNNEDTLSSSSIIIEDNEAPPLVSSSKEQIYPISIDVGDEYIQEDSADLDKNTLITPFNPLMFEEAESSSTTQDPSNMHEFNQVYPSIHTWTKGHPLEQVIGDTSKPVMTRSRLNTDVEVFPRPCDRIIIGVKWLWKNKTNAENIVVRNKSRLVAKGYCQEEGINFEESFALVHQSPCGIFICQLQYTLELLKKHGINGYDSISTPMATAILDVDLHGTPTDQMKYHSMIGGLIVRNTKSVGHFQYR
ncbi:integrase, catalytic region, zinc finger, CCHC-type containing protein [Tanacetum coccineum]|uniref:Integrase, catalytic region, zinc finger, CCHC-type containing protein n=1 Tax=Tanacetum coccineum TaxID=301880 RepID=A0ABQ5BS51_9ASTR